MGSLLGKKRDPTTLSFSGTISATERGLLNRGQKLSAATVGPLYFGEICLALLLVALYKKADRPLPAFLSSPAGHIYVVSFVGVVAASIAITIDVWRNGNSRSTFASALGWNLCSIILMFGTAECAIRSFSVATPAGPVFANTLLLPKHWPSIAAQNKALLERAAGHQSFLVYDSLLGWTVGRNRRSADYNLEFERQLFAERKRRGERLGAPSHAPAFSDPRNDSVYLSSAEGLRSAKAGISLVHDGSNRRIALVGDSFTFGLEVRYEDTWGRRLEKELGDEFPVLNFGVDGYGVDQAYLRYRRDVPSWKPEVVILGVIDDDLRRTMCVYGFLCFPRSEIPFAKPHFVVSSDSLLLLNEPIPAPERLFSSSSIVELPFVHEDEAFDPSEWQWRMYDASYVIRYVLSTPVGRRWSTGVPVYNEERLQRVNAELFRAFRRSVQEQGAVPIIAYLPSRQTEFFKGAGRRESIAKKLLRDFDIPFVDLSACVEAVREEDRFVVVHYSPSSNAAVAHCLATRLRPILEHRTGTRPS